MNNKILDIPKCVIRLVKEEYHNNHTRTYDINSYIITIYMIDKYKNKISEEDLGYLQDNLRKMKLGIEYISYMGDKLVRLDGDKIERVKIRDVNDRFIFYSGGNRLHFVNKVDLLL
jgi:hypothetical protein